MTQTVADIDIDFADRNLVLEELLHIPAAVISNGEIKKHPTGVYFHDIPIDPMTGIASIDHNIAKEYGYFKLDFLNLNVYKDIKDEDHLQRLMDTEPLWKMLEEREIVDSLFHLRENFDIVNTMRPRSIEQLAAVLAIKIPCKRYLIGKSWETVEKQIWLPDPKGSFQMKKSHAIAYSFVVIVQMNLLLEAVDDRL